MKQLPILKLKKDEFVVESIKHQTIHNKSNHFVIDENFPYPTKHLRINGSLLGRYVIRPIWCADDEVECDCTEFRTFSANAKNGDILLRLNQDCSIDYLGVRYAFIQNQILPGVYYDDNSHSITVLFSDFNSTTVEIPCNYFSFFDPICQILVDTFHPIITETKKCPYCNGKGIVELLISKSVCTNCNGLGITAK